MVEIKSRKHGIDFYKVWFAKEPFKKAGVITYRQSSCCEKGAEPFDTLITDITEDAEAIKGKFAKNCKYEVNRAQREDISVRMKAGRDISDEDIDTFVRFFGDFWKSKQMSLDDPNGLKKELLQYRDADALAIAIASVGSKDSVYHTYVYDGTRARLWHSASLFRLLDGEKEDDRKIVGMANRYLHYADMLFFKEKGLKIYDWGGAGLGEDVANITKFKESFGGIPEKSYEYEEVRGLKAHVFKWIVNIMEDAML